MNAVLGRRSTSAYRPRVATKKRAKKRAHPRKPIDPELWREEHAHDLPPEEPPPLRRIDRRTDANSDRLVAVEFSPPPARVKATDVPRGTVFDPELGVLDFDYKHDEEWRAPSVEALQLWSRLAVDVAGRLRALLESVDAAHAAACAGGDASGWNVLKLPALDQLRALHRELMPVSWRTVLASAYERAALIRAEERQHSRTGQDRSRLVPPAHKIDGAELLARLKFVDEAARTMTPRHLAPHPNLLDNDERGDLPTNLTPEILGAILERVQLGKGGRNGGGITVDRAVELTELAAVDIEAFSKQMLRGAKRRRSRKRAK
jgi:hypothetical protein